MFDTYDFIIKYTEIINLTTELYARIYTDIADEEDRIAMLLTLAGNFLHDVPKKEREKFFEEYEDLHKFAEIMCGEVDLDENE